MASLLDDVLAILGGMQLKPSESTAALSQLLPPHLSGARLPEFQEFQEPHEPGEGNETDMVYIVQKKEEDTRLLKTYDSEETKNTYSFAALYATLTTKPADDNVPKVFYYDKCINYPNLHRYVTVKGDAIILKFFWDVSLQTADLEDLQEKDEVGKPLWYNLTEDKLKIVQKKKEANGLVLTRYDRQRVDAQIEMRAFDILQYSAEAGGADAEGPSNSNTTQVVAHTEPSAQRQLIRDLVEATAQITDVNKTKDGVTSKIEQLKASSNDLIGSFHLENYSNDAFAQALHHQEGNSPQLGSASCVTPSKIIEWQPREAGASYTFKTNTGALVMGNADRNFHCTLPAVCALCMPALDKWREHPSSLKVHTDSIVKMLRMLADKQEKIVADVKLDNTLMQPLGQTGVVLSLISDYAPVVTRKNLEYALAMLRRSKEKKQTSFEDYVASYKAREDTLVTASRDSTPFKGATTVSTHAMMFDTKMKALQNSERELSTTLSFFTYGLPFLDEKALHILSLGCLRYNKDSKIECHVAYLAQGSDHYRKIFKDSYEKPKDKQQVVDSLQNYDYDKHWPWVHNCLHRLILHKNNMPKMDYDTMATLWIFAVLKLVHDANVLRMQLEYVCTGTRWIAGLDGTGEESTCPLDLPFRVVYALDEEMMKKAKDLVDTNGCLLNIELDPVNDIFGNNSKAYEYVKDQVTRIKEGSFQQLELLSDSLSTSINSDAAGDNPALVEEKLEALRMYLDEYKASLTLVCNAILPAFEEGGTPYKSLEDLHTALGKDPSENVATI